MAINNIPLMTSPAAAALTNSSAASGTPGASSAKTNAGLKKACQQFESYFVDNMLKEMRKTIPKDTLTGDSDDQQAIFQEMSDQAVADSVAKNGSFGIAKMLERQLSPPASSHTFTGAITSGQTTSGLSTLSGPRSINLPSTASTLVTGGNASQVYSAMSNLKNGAVRQLSPMADTSKM